MTILKYLAALMIIFLSGCGSGGGGGDTAVSLPAAHAKAILKLSLTGTLPAGSSIVGAGFIVTLPADVTPELVNNAIATGVITPSGTFAGGTQTPPVYTQANGAAAGKIQLALVNNAASGVTQVGEVATVVLRLANNAAPVASSFSLAGVSVIDMLGNTISGMGVQVTGVTLE